MFRERRKEGDGRKRGRKLRDRIIAHWEEGRLRPSEVRRKERENPREMVTAYCERGAKLGIKGKKARTGMVQGKIEELRDMEII